MRRPHIFRLSCTRGAVAALAVACAVTGCHRTTELGELTPAPGSRIVASLTPLGVMQVQPAMGDGVRGLQAVVLTTHVDDWTLSVERVSGDRNVSTQWAGERVLFRRDWLQDVRLQRIDAVRTGILTTAVAGAVLVLGRAFTRGQAGAGDTPLPPGQPQ